MSGSSGGGSSSESTIDDDIKARVLSFVGSFAGDDISDLIMADQTTNPFDSFYAGYTPQVHSIDQFIENIRAEQTELDRKLAPFNVLLLDVERRVEEVGTFELDVFDEIAPTTGVYTIPATLDFVTGETVENPSDLITPATLKTQLDALITTDDPDNLKDLIASLQAIIETYGDRLQVTTATEWNLIITNAQTSVNIISETDIANSVTAFDGLQAGIMADDIARMLTARRTHGALITSAIFNAEAVMLADKNLRVAQFEGDLRTKAHFENERNAVALVNAWVQRDVGLAGSIGYCAQALASLAKTNVDFGDSLYRLAAIAQNYDDLGYKSVAAKAALQAAANDLTKVGIDEVKVHLAREQIHFEKQRITEELQQKYASLWISLGSTLNTMHQTNIEMQRIKMEGERLILISRQEQANKLMAVAEVGIRWDYEVFQYAANTLASASGGTATHSREPSQMSSAIGGALSGAAAGASIGTAISPGYGTAIGAGIGAIAGLLAS